MALMLISPVACNKAANELENPLNINSLFPGDLRMWEHIFDTEGEYVFESAPFGVILPHHMIAEKQLVKFYKGLSGVIDPSVIVIIGPNHYENGEANVQTCKNCVYQTVEGDIELDHDLVNLMFEHGIAAYVDETFIKEHAIFTHAPFIKKHFPKAKIVPIVLQWEMPQDEVLELSEWLDKNLPGDALVLASVDFSHYIPVEAADFHDISAFRTISNFDFENVYDLEIDSPSSIYTILSLMEKRGYEKAVRLEHTNLAQFLSKPEEITTSHQFFAFYKGEVEETRGVTMMVTGNIEMDNNVLSVDKGWDWDRNYDEKNDETIGEFLRDIKGSEDRFLVGSDFLLFDLNEGNCMEERQNGFKVAFCKVGDGDDLEKSLKKVRDVDKNADLVYLQLDSGQISEEKGKLARIFVDAGADIVVGKGSHSPELLGIYKDGLIFNSLGGFISYDSWSGMILGINITSDNYEIYLFPIDVKGGYPKLMRLEKREAFFAEFIEEISKGNEFTDKIQIDYTKRVVKILR